MRVYGISLILFGYAALTCCYILHTDELIPIDDEQQFLLPQRLESRSPKYDFGLGKRRYMMQSGQGQKRLPHYNFGLGKRAPVYNLDYSDDDWSSDNWGSPNDFPVQADENANMDFAQQIKAAQLINENTNKQLQQQQQKVQQQANGSKLKKFDYGYGGKKRRLIEDLEKRLSNRYNFGLGRR